MKFLPVAVLLLPIAFAPMLVFAQNDAAPPLAEYNNVKPGLLMPGDATATAATPAAGQDARGAGQPDEASRAMSFNDLMAAWKQGQYDLVAKHILPLAQNGSHPAEELLGIMYRNGQGVPKDPEKALEWLNKAADAGLPLAEHHLGVIYFTGDGVSPDSVKALMWLEIAVAHYPDGAEKDRAKQDRDNVAARLTRRDRAAADKLAHDWLDKKGEGHLLDLPQ